MRWRLRTAFICLATAAAGAGSAGCDGPPDTAKPRPPATRPARPATTGPTTSPADGNDVTVEVVPVVPDAASLPVIRSAEAYARYTQKTGGILDSVDRLIKGFGAAQAGPDAVTKFGAESKAVGEAVEKWKKELSEEEAAYPSAEQAESAWNHIDAAARLWGVVEEQQAELQRRIRAGDASGINSIRGVVAQLSSDLAEIRAAALAESEKARHLLQTREGTAGVPATAPAATAPAATAPAMTRPANGG